MPIRDLALGIFCMALWGAQIVPLKTALTELGPFTVSAIRWAGMCLLLLPFAPRPRGWQQWRCLIAVACLAGMLHFWLMFVALPIIPAAVAGVVYQLNTPFALLLGWLLLHEKPLPSALAGIALAFAGVVVIGAEGLGHGVPQGQSPLLGTVLIALAALCLAGGNVMVRKLGPVPTITLNAWQGPLALPPALLLAWLFDKNPVHAVLHASPKVWLALAWATILGGMLGWQIWFALLARHPVQKVAPLILLVPPFAIAAGVLVLGESLSLLEILGAVLAIGGVALALLGPRLARLLRRSGVMAR